jgi:hypothetical protein
MKAKMKIFRKFTNFIYFELVDKVDKFCPQKQQTFSDLIFQSIFTHFWGNICPLCPLLIFSINYSFFTNLRNSL